MWLCFSDAFLSVVAIDGHQDILRVRARREGDIEAVFPDAIVAKTPGRDYLYRSEIARSRIVEVLTQRVESLTATNFKDSVVDRKLHAAYGDVWRRMSRLQSIPPYSRAAR